MYRAGGIFFKIDWENILIQGKVLSSDIFGDASDIKKTSVVTRLEKFKAI